MLTTAIQDYLKRIYKLEDSGAKVSTTRLSEIIKVTPASVTGMVKKLAGMGLVSYERYQGVTLTPAGRKIALEMIRHHRLVELYLVEAMGLSWDKVHDEAEKWEHVLSEELEDRMDEILGFPTHDPHGAPIPKRDGTIVHTPSKCLTQVSAGEKLIIYRVNDHDPEILRYLGNLGLFPKTPIEIMAVAPFEGPITVKINQKEHVLGRQVATQVFVHELITESE